MIDDQIAAAFAWWRDAGVDGDLRDEPAQWLTSPETELPPPEPAFAPPPPPKPLVPARQPLDRSAWPQTHEAFGPWWLAEPRLIAGAPAGRIAPRGPTQAELMVLVPQPEAADRDLLLSGPQGQLLSAFLAAAGIPPDKTYFASVLPRHMPMPDWDAMGRDGLGDVALLHIRLARPQRLLCFGSSILPLLGHDPANNPAEFRELDHEGSKVPLMVARDLAALLERPRWKAVFWQRWLEWTV